MQSFDQGKYVREFINSSKGQASALIRKLISPSLRFKLRNRAIQLREQLGRARLWQWEISRLTQSTDHSPHSILYIGRKLQLDLAKLLVVTDGNVDTGQAKANNSNQTTIVSEAPIPGALRVPGYLRVVIPLKKPIAEITAGFGDNLRRLLRKHLAGYRMQQALVDAEIDRANQEMLQPYAIARHGDAAAQIAPNEVRRIAQNAGRLDFVLLGEEVVACNLGCEFTMNKKKYWSTIRFGYPEAVFSDTKRLAETNAVSFFLALEWALKYDFDYYDMGTCLGRPEDESLQWKKRWGGLLDTTGSHSYFYVRLPSAGAAEFLWNAPLFSVEGNHLTLHLGLPDGQSDEDIVLRYRKMTFAGLFRVYLHCTKPCSEYLLQKMHSLYKHQESPPTVVVKLTN